MNKEFVPYIEAVKLKRLEFDEPCFAYYENQDKHLVINYNNTPLTEEQQKRPGLYKIDNRNSALPQWATAAPLYQQVFRWFREKYSLHANINSVADSPNGQGFTPNGKYGGTIDDVMIGKEMFNTDTVCLITTSSSYEEAELACLKKLIEIVKTKK
jgi:hypothetical protein